MNTEETADLGQVVEVARATAGAVAGRSLAFAVLLAGILPPNLHFMGPKLAWLPALGVGVGVGLLLFLLTAPVHLLRRDTITLHQDGFATTGSKVGRHVVNYQNVWSVVSGSGTVTDQGKTWRVHYAQKRPATIGSVLTKSQPGAVERVVAASTKAARGRAVRSLNAGKQYESPLGPRLDKTEFYWGRKRSIPIREVVKYGPTGLEHEQDGKRKTERVSTRPGFDVVMESLVESLKKLRLNQ